MSLKIERLRQTDVLLVSRMLFCGPTFRQLKEELVRSSASMLDIGVSHAILLNFEFTSLNFELHR